MSATAVIITGQPRTFAHCWKTQREAVFRKLENPHFFISFAGDVTIDDEAAVAVLKESYPVYFEKVEQPQMPEENRARYEGASIWAPYFRSVPVEGIWKQFWHLARGWEFFTERQPMPVFGAYVRLRPDLHFHNFKEPRRSLQLPGVYTPWWGSWGGIPDRFAYIVGHGAAEQYFNVFHKLNELLAEGCAYHPETMLGRAMERAGVRVFETMDAEFTTIRMKGDKRPHDAPVYTPRDWARVIGRLAEAEG